MSGEPKVHDWRTGRCFGNDYSVSPVTPDGAKIKMTGWRSGIGQGDVLLLHHSIDGKMYECAYEVDSVRYYRDPRDMFSLVASYQAGGVAKAVARLAEAVNP